MLWAFVTLASMLPGGVQLLAVIARLPFLHLNFDSFSSILIFDARISPRPEASSFAFCSLHSAFCGCFLATSGPCLLHPFPKQPDLSTYNWNLPTASTFMVPTPGVATAFRFAPRFPRPITRPLTLESGAHTSQTHQRRETESSPLPSPQPIQPVAARPLQSALPSPPRVFPVCAAKCIASENPQRTTTYRNPTDPRHRATKPPATQTEARDFVENQSIRSLLVSPASPTTLDPTVEPSDETPSRSPNSRHLCCPTRHPPTPSPFIARRAPRRLQQQQQHHRLSVSPR
ncbi:hypothetical protein VTJ04DRAFT_7997 [Mycothermus thermophilus]|uniref:uncharacterized protein n=1 Tax=Humicola insolens TaxID=85995 RepID=UPI0037427B1E